MPDQARIFISYSRKDGAKFAAELRKLLERENISVWQDIITLEGDQDWWSQIEDALKSKALQHFVLIVTPSGLASPVVRREIRLARAAAAKAGKAAPHAAHGLHSAEVRGLRHSRN